MEIRKMERQKMERQKMERRTKTRYLLTAAILGFQLTAAPVLGSTVSWAMEAVPEGRTVSDGNPVGSDTGKDGLQTGSVSGNLMVKQEYQEKVYYEGEAEDALLTNGALTKTCEAASGGELVHYLGTDNGGHANGTAAFTVPMTEAGSYRLQIYYAGNSTDRYFDVEVNGKTVYNKALPATESFEIPCVTPVGVDVELVKGDNTISFSCANWYAPNLDKIKIVPAQGDPAQAGYYEAEDGTLEGKAKVTGSGNASGGQIVGDLGGGENEDKGYITIKDVFVEKEGIYEAAIFYVAGDSREFTVSVNGNQESSCPSTGDWNTVGRTTMKLYLKAGGNTIRFGNSHGYAPNLDRIYVPEKPADMVTDADGRLTLQAEDGILTNGAAKDYNSSACAGGGKVSNIGGDTNGSVTFENIKIDQAGTYAIDVAYSAKEDRSFQITVDGVQKRTIVCPTGYEWDVPNRHIVTFELEAGTHTVSFDNPSGYSPNLDEIKIYRCREFSMGKYSFLYDLETGRYSMIAEGRTRILDAASAVNWEIHCSRRWIALHMSSA